jgi:hypothetical protein
MREACNLVFNLNLVPLLVINKCQTLLPPLQLGCISHIIDYIVDIPEQRTNIIHEKVITIGVIKYLIEIVAIIEIITAHVS